MAEAVVADDVDIVDAHVHLWDTNDLDYELFRDRPGLQGSFRLARYEDEARPRGVTGAIVVEAASVGADPQLETEWLVREVAGSEFTRGLVAWAPLDDPKRLDPHLDWLQAQAGPLLVGVRRTFQFEPDDFPRRPEVIAGCRVAAERGLVLELALSARSVPATLELLDACPEATFVLDSLDDDRDLRELARRPQLVCKVARADDAAFADFGASRCLYGSGWPAHPIVPPLDGLEPTDLAAVLSATAARVYGLV